jgi:hypothetical protein
LINSLLEKTQATERLPFLAQACSCQAYFSITKRNGLFVGSCPYLLKIEINRLSLNFTQKWGVYSFFRFDQ